MLERTLSNTQLPILKWKGKFICSSFDPVREGEKWVIEYRPQVSNFKNILVLGAGCGYHLAALNKKFPEKKFLVVESNPQFAEICREFNSLEIATVKILVGTSVEIIREDEDFRAFLETGYTVLNFGPVVQHEKDFYGQIMNLVFGRTEEGLQFLLNTRPELKMALGESFSKRIRSVSKELFSIKNLDFWMQDSNNSESKQIVNTLKELIN